MPPVPPEYFIKPAHQQILDCSVEPTAICKHYSQWWKKPEAHK